MAAKRRDAGRSDALHDEGQGDRAAAWFRYAATGEHLSLLAKRKAAPGRRKPLTTSRTELEKKGCCAKLGSRPRTRDIGGNTGGRQRKAAKRPVDAPD